MLLWPPPECKFQSASAFFGSAPFQNVAVVHTRLQISIYIIICHRMLSSKSYKNTNKKHQSWSALFLTLRVHRPFWRKYSVIISLFGVPPFVCVCLLFRIDVFPIEKITFWGPHGRPICYKIHICCFLLRNTYILARSRIACFHIDFTFATRPC